METVEQFEHAGRIVTISHDDDPMSPADWNSAGTIAVSQPRDRRAGTIPGAETREPETRYREGWEVEARYLERFAGAVVLPLEIAYDWRPGIGVADDYTNADGIVYATAAEIAHEWEGDRAAAESYLRARIDELNQYLQGDVYYYSVEDKQGNHLDSCGSLYGLDYARESATEAAAEHRAPVAHELAALLLPMGA